jgi:hypothetical protein
MSVVSSGPDGEPRDELTLTVTRRQRDALLGALQRDLRRAAHQTENPRSGPAARARYIAARRQAIALTELLGQLLGPTPERRIDTSSEPLINRNATDGAAR